MSDSTHTSSNGQETATPKRRGRPPGINRVKGTSAPEVVAQVREMVNETPESVASTPEIVKQECETAKAPPESGVPAPAETLPKAKSLLEQARRPKNYAATGKGPTRQIQIDVMNPPSEVPFRSWPDENDYLPIAILKTKTGGGEKQVLLLAADVAEGLAGDSRLKDALLVPCITSTGKLFIYPMIVPNPAERMGFKSHKAMAFGCEKARTAWASFEWANGALSLGSPKVDPGEPQWPTGQSLDEIYEIALEGVLITDPNDATLKALDRTVRPLEG
jgi:hypothetical protein